MSVLSQPVSSAEPLPPPDPPLKKMNVFLMVVIMFVTLGIYVPVWYARRVKAFNALRSTVKLSLALPLASLTLLLMRLGAAFLQGVFESVGARGLADLLGAYSGLVNLAYVVVMLILAFRVRDIVQDHLRAQVADLGGAVSVSLQSQVYSLSGVWTFVFNAFYLQWKVNEYHRELTRSTAED